MSCLENKVAVVTGGNSGIGFETVKGLCQRGMCVVMGEFILDTCLSVQD